MKKIWTYLTTIILLTTISANVLACQADNVYLIITDDDLFNDKSEKKPMKLNNLAFAYTRGEFVLEAKRLGYDADNFLSWDWKLTNRKRIVGFNPIEIANPERLYWKITIRKTAARGVFVSDLQSSKIRYNRNEF